MTAGLLVPQPDAPPMPAAWSLYFASDNIEADLARAAEFGAKVVSPAMAVGDFGSMALCEDPGGAAFSFWQAGRHVGSQVTDEPDSTTWFELSAPNAKQARDFYTAVLKASADPVPGGLAYYVLRHGDKMLAGIVQIDPSWDAFRPQWIAYFAVENAEEAVALVKEHGGKALSTIDDSPFGRIVALNDPGGAYFKIVQPPTG